MRFMNDYDIELARRRFDAFPNLALGVQVIDNLRQWADANSDGWHSWPKPCRAASKLIDLIEDEQNIKDWANGVLTDIDEKELARAIIPIKSFLTRHGASWQEVLG